ncbi:hypothetical protein BRADI_1g17665v3 [Brachypodium distachyon]|uniref:Ubiquinol-cytochrome c reductase complex 6.7 kDa protein n=1 Tax=Brachypodium distachyon TaxID=15368 RepID=I1GR44_BRADI|nr:hypothetical protein BRADI_1g17665v3 [Brachypodium distachyon]
MALPASGLSRLLASRRIQPADISAAATWGVAAGSAAIYLVQPFDWIKKTFFEKPEAEA